MSDRATYRSMPDYIRLWQPYTHGSSYAIRRQELTPTGGLYDIYEVYSYSTLIFSWNLTKKQVEFWNDHKYSMTTSRLQNIIRRVHPEVES